VTAAELQEKVSDLARSNAQLEREREALEQRRADLEKRHAELEQECDEYRKLVALLQEQNEKLKRGLLGQKAERLPKNDAQLSLSILELALGRSAADGDAEEAAPADDEQTIGEHTRRRPVRKPLPEDLPRVTVEVVPPEVQRDGLDAFERIGQETRCVLERRPASSVVVELIYPKFVRKDRVRNEATEVFVAPAVELPIERGLAGPGMLADTIVRRWQDHQPLTRLEGIYAREGLPIAKSTLCTWHEQLAALAQSLVEAMIVDALGSPYLCVDATGVLVLAREQCRNGHFWVMVAPEKHVLYRFSERHDSAAVDDLLRGYQGYLVADAHAVYDHLYRDGAVTEVACWAHQRRYFFKALESDPERARYALSRIGALFRIERSIADLPTKKKEAARRAKSKAIADEFFAWCGAQASQVLDESPIAAGIGYALNQRVALRRFLDDGRLPLSNNISELHLRRQVLGRRNWLFVGSSDGGRVNTVFVSLLASARLHDIEPLAYIRDLFCLLPAWPLQRVLELAPAYWKKTLEQVETQEKLAANVFRRVVLQPPA
jgi:transposase